MRDAVVVIALVEAFFGGLVSDQDRAGEDDRRFSQGDQLLGDQAFDGIGYRGSPNRRAGTHRIIKTGDMHQGIPTGCAVIDDNIGDIGQFLAAGMQCRRTGAVVERDNRNDRESLAFRPPGQHPQRLR